MRSITRPRSNRQKGFTIVELMISTAVFTSLLLLILTAITQIGRMYYKGIALSKVQGVTTSIIDSISQEIQYSTNKPSLVVSGSKRVLCVGNSRYFFQLDQKKSATIYGLWVDDSNNGDSSNACLSSDNLQATNIPTGGLNGRDLLINSMRIVKLELDTNNGDSQKLYGVTIRVAYGDDDLLEAVNESGQVLDDRSANLGLTTCKGSIVGSQFCGISELSATIMKRL